MAEKTELRIPVVAPKRAATAKTIARQIRGRARRALLEAKSAASNAAAEVHRRVPITVSRRLMILTE
jgi:hypothetical protein